MDENTASIKSHAAEIDGMDDILTDIIGRSTVSPGIAVKNYGLLRIF